MNKDRTHGQAARGQLVSRDEGAGPLAVWSVAPPDACCAIRRPPGGTRSIDRR